VNTAVVDQSQISELKRFAKQLEEAGSGEETRAAARAILLLADEVESLTLALAAADGEDRHVAVGAEDDDADGAVSWFRRTFSTGATGDNGDSAA
jgi:hypothetical protein